jgi:hypothetical protein
MQPVVRCGPVTRPLKNGMSVSAQTFMKITDISVFFHVLVLLGMNIHLAISKCPDIRGDSEFHEANEENSVQYQKIFQTFRKIPFNTSEYLRCGQESTRYVNTSDSQAHTPPHVYALVARLIV